MKTAQLYQSFYTKSEPIVTYMIDMLSLKKNMNLFEPCAGDGVFIDGILERYPDCLIEAFELNPHAVNILLNKYGDKKNITIKKGDMLTDPNLLWIANSGGTYDRIIANPPYGAWQEYSKRKLLKKLYPCLYVKETYSLFLYRCIQLLKDQGILVFIIPDTFLNLHMHTKLREYILKKTKIIEIALFPSSFFPGVNFGYSNLSIITLQRCKDEKKCMTNNFRVICGFSEVDDLLNLDSNTKTQFKTYVFAQENIFKNIDHALFINGDPKVTQLINSSVTRIKDVADCVTGFYSGNDKEYLRTVGDDQKNASKYKSINDEFICEDYKKQADILDGIEGKKHFIPIVKGGGIKFYKSDKWFMDWSKEAVTKYKKSKKARFQNSDFYFKYGIGVPMISSTQITAALIDNKLFDQSIVGIFPKDKKLIFYLLAFFNTPTCNKLIRTINPSANNPANYIKKIPLVISKSKIIIEKIDRITKEIIKELRDGKKLDNTKHSELNNIFYGIYNF